MTFQFKKTHVIMNPASAGGKTRRKLNEMIDLLNRYSGKNYSFYVTQKPFDACFSAKQAIGAGSELIISIGGDGTIQEIVNGFFSNGRPINPDCHLGIINGGTGQGFVQSLGLPPRLEPQFDIAFRGKSDAIDIGRIVFYGENGEQKERCFVNECQAGIGGEVVKGVKSTLKRLGGRIAFGLSSLFNIFRYPNQEMTVTIDDTLAITQPFVGIVMANGDTMAGGMHLTPGASFDDRLLDILLIRGQSILQRLRGFSRIYSGRHIELPTFSHYRGKSIHLSSAEQVLVEADGELLGFLPCHVEVLPAALNVRLISPEI